MNWNVMARTNWIGEQKLAEEGSVEFKSNNSMSTADLAYSEKFSFHLPDRGPFDEPQDLQLRHFSQPSKSSSESFPVDDKNSIHSQW